MLRKRLAASAVLLLSGFFNSAAAATEEDMESILTFTHSKLHMTADVNGCTLVITEEYPNSCQPDPTNRPQKRVIRLDLTTIGRLETTNTEYGTYVLLLPPKPRLRDFFRPVEIGYEGKIFYCEGGSIKADPEQFPGLTIPSYLTEQEISSISDFLSTACK